MTRVPPPTPAGMRARQRKLRRTGWLCVVAAVGLNVTLFGTLSLINRSGLDGDPPETLRSFDVVAAPIEHRLVVRPRAKPTRERSADKRPAAPRRGEVRSAPRPMAPPPIAAMLQPRLPAAIPPTDRAPIPQVVEPSPAVRPSRSPTALSTGPRTGLATGPSKGRWTGPMNVAAVDRAPRAVYSPPTPYPRWARAAGKEATVEVHFVVDAGGGVSNVTVKRLQGDRRFGPVVVAAVQRWRFEPGIHDGRPVAVQCWKTLHFRLREQR